MNLLDSDIDQLAGRELDARCAYHLFGWEWWRDKRSKLCCIFNVKAQHVSMFSPEIYERVESWPDLEQRYRDWDRSCYSDDGKTWMILPRYSTDLGACAEILAWLDSNSPTSKHLQTICDFPQVLTMELKNWDGPSTWRASWKCLDFPRKLFTEASTLPLTICRFALRTWVLLQNSTEAKT